MSYPYLLEGDALPAVAVLQKLLRRTGHRIGADGHFGPLTRQAVLHFQRTHPGLAPDGIVGPQTWPRLVARHEQMQVLDCIDIFDPDLLSTEVQDIRRGGGNPLVLGGMCNGVEQAVAAILQAAGFGSVFLLRFHGHGGPGWAGISAGTGADSTPANRSAMEVNNRNVVARLLARLKPIFGPYGCIQFMHCSTGRGSNGTQLLQTVAQATGVPATAALRTQYAGGSATFRYEGPTNTVFPYATTMQAWGAALPEMAGMSIA